MALLLLILTIIAVVAGFTGLVLIIKGFVDKSNKKVWIGTALVCLMLSMAVCGAFVIGKKAIKAKKHFEKEHFMMNGWCGDGADFKMHKNCCPGDSITTGDSTEVQVIVEKKCIKKCGTPCPHHGN